MLHAAILSCLLFGSAATSTGKGPKGRKKVVSLGEIEQLVAVPADFAQKARPAHLLAPPRPSARRGEADADAWRGENFSGFFQIV